MPLRDVNRAERSSDKLIINIFVKHGCGVNRNYLFMKLFVTFVCSGGLIGGLGCTICDTHRP